MLRSARGLISTALVVGLLLGSAAGAVDPVGESFVIAPFAEATTAADNGLGTTLLAWFAAGEIYLQKIEGEELAGPRVAIPTYNQPIFFDLEVDSQGAATLASFEASLFPGLPPPPSAVLYRTPTDGRVVEDPVLLIGGSQTHLSADGSGSFSLLDYAGPFPDNRLRLRSFDASGQSQQEVTQVGDLVRRAFLFYDVAVNGNGETLAVWSEITCSGGICSFQGLFGSLYGQDGRARESRIPLAEKSTGGSAVALPDGRFLVLWNEPGVASAEVSASFAVRARTVSRGTLGPIRSVKAETSGQTPFLFPGARPRAAVDVLGQVLVTWQEKADPDDPGWRLLAQEFDPDSGAVGFRYRLSSEVGLPFGGHAGNGVAVEGPGRFLVTWLEQGDFESSLLGQRFAVDPEAGCLSRESNLCLLDGRFEVTGQFRRPSGRLDRVRFQALGDSSGSASFLRQGNAEGLVKMLDGRSTNGHYWFFSGGLSNVEYSLTVKDLQTGQSREYLNPQGTLASFGDVRAFMEEAPGAPIEVTSRPDPAFSLPTSSSSCIPSRSLLCLEDERFSVSLEWRDGRGNVGTGKAVPLSSDSGVFWFFRRGNPEVMVKVLDGRAVNGNFWVFYASATEVEFTLTVTDNETQVFKSYQNPQGTFASGADLRAFQP